MRNELPLCPVHYDNRGLVKYYCDTEEDIARLQEKLRQQSLLNRYLGSTALRHEISQKNQLLLAIQDRLSLSDVAHYKAWKNEVADILESRIKYKPI